MLNLINYLAKQRSTSRVRCQGKIQIVPFELDLVLTFARVMHLDASRDIFCTA